MKISSAPKTTDGEFLQRTESWFADRCGKVTGSPVLKVYKRLKNGSYAAEREKYKLEKIAERLTGRPASSYTSPAMQRGIDKEAEARERYKRVTNLEVVEVGFIPHPEIGNAGSSPDGFVGEDGILEIKAPNSATAIEVLLNDYVDETYFAQIQWAMACTGRLWAHYVVYDDRLPDSMQLYIKRIERNDELIKAVEKEVRQFIVEVDEAVELLWNKYPI